MSGRGVGWDGKGDGGEMLGFAIVGLVACDMVGGGTAGGLCGRVT